MLRAAGPACPQLAQSAHCLSQQCVKCSNSLHLPHSSYGYSVQPMWSIYSHTTMLVRLFWVVCPSAASFSLRCRLFFYGAFKCVIERYIFPFMYQYFSNSLFLVCGIIFFKYFKWFVGLDKIFKLFLLYLIHSLVCVGVCSSQWESCSQMTDYRGWTLSLSPMGPRGQAGWKVPLPSEPLSWSRCNF